MNEIFWRFSNVVFRQNWGQIWIEMRPTDDFNTRSQDVTVICPLRWSHFHILRPFHLVSDLNLLPRMVQ
jgi:hypothetical protein